MNESQRYVTARAFRQALEARLQVRARAAGVDVGRLRKQVSFDCFLTRLFPSGSDEAGCVLKGGYALELRFLHARATKDIDLTLSSDVIQTSTFQDQRHGLREHIRRYASRTLSDFFEYFIGSSTLDLEGAPEGGFRFPVEATMDGRVFANFHVDIGVGDATDPPLEILQGGDWLEFAGIARPQFIAVSREQQWAEKLHAYTRPRQERPNSRTKDLVDLVLLINSGGLSAERLRHCVARTFEKRASQPIPEVLPSPPPEWNPVFERLAREAEIIIDMTSGFEVVAAFWRSLTNSDID